MLQESNSKEECAKGKHINDILKDWKILWQVSSFMNFKKGQVLFYRGHAPYGVFVLISGEVTLRYESETGTNIIANLPESTPFGFDFIAMNEVYPCTATAESDVSVLFLPKTAPKTINQAAK